MLRAALNGLYLFSGYAAGFFLVAIFALMMTLSIGRQVGFNVPAGDDIVSWCMAATAFLGLAHTFRSGELIRVGLLVDNLTGRTRRIAEIAALAIGSGFTSFFAWHAVKMTWQSWLFDDMAQGVLAIPLWIPQIGFASGLVILAIAFLDEFIHVLTGHAPHYDRPPPKTAEEVIERAAQSGL